MANKYVSPSKLSLFLDNLRSIFSPLTHAHSLSDISDYKVDTELSSTSNNPIANSAIDAEFDAVATAMNALDSALDDKVDKSNIIDNLTTTTTDQPLSANQGKILQDQIANITAIPDSEIIALFST